VTAAVMIGLGSNLGDRLANLQAAVDRLDGIAGLALEAVSSVYASEYVGPGHQQPYLNAVAAALSDLEPEALLPRLQAVEAALGRPPRTHMQPRTIDCDLLLWDDRIVRTPELTVPHPRLHERAFVLQPLAEVAPRMVVPDCGLTVAELCAIIGHRPGPWVRRTELTLRLPAAGRKEQA